MFYVLSFKCSKVRQSALILFNTKPIVAVYPKMSWQIGIVCNANTKPSVLDECFYIQCRINLHNHGPNTSGGVFVPFSNFGVYMLFLHYLCNCLCFRNNLFLSFPAENNFVFSITSQRCIQDLFKHLRCRTL